MILNKYRCDNCKMETENKNEVVGVHPTCTIFAEDSYPVEYNKPEKCPVHICLECYRLYVLVAAENLVPRVMLNPKITDPVEQRKILDQDRIKREAEKKVKIGELAYLLKYKIVNGI